MRWAPGRRIHLALRKGLCLNRLLRMIRRAFLVLGIVTTAFVAIAGLWAVVSMTRDTPVTYESIEDHFKYGSIGSEPGGNLFAPIGGALPPYWVFKALPSVCKEKLPRGYATFGLISEA